LGPVGHLAADPTAPAPVRSSDPADDYLIALAATERAILVSGDGHLTVLAGEMPVRTPAVLLSDLEAREDVGG
jgi:predicted nucleic acid-binding protein